MSIIAVIQMNSTDEVSVNLSSMGALMQEAVNQGAQLAVLPECFALMQRSRQQLYDSAEAFGAGPIQDGLSAVARRYGIWVVAGSLPLKSDHTERVYNSSLVFDHQGAPVARYDKIHLFDVSLATGEQYAESDYTAAGQSVCVVDTPAGSFGLSICYDLRFPEMYRKLVEQGAQILTVPSAFTVVTGKAHWRCLLRARAVENGCYVLAPAQTGTHVGGRITYGHSMIIDPWGRVLAELPQQVGVITARVDLDALQSMRTQLPCLHHRRPDLFV